MSETCYDATGVLIFGGEPIITPAIKLFFDRYDLANESPVGKPNERCIAMIDGEHSREMWSFLEELVSDAKDIGVSFDHVDTCSVADVLIAIGRHFGKDITAALDAIGIPGDLNSTVELDELFAIVMEIADGHNLVEIRLEGAWHGLKHGETGGWGNFRSKSYCLVMNTTDVLDFGKAMDDAISAGAGPSAVVVVNMVNKLLGGISDRGFAKAVAHKAGEFLLKREG